MFHSSKRVVDNKIQKELSDLIRLHLFPYKPLVLGISNS